VAYSNKTLARDSEKSDGPRTIGMVGSRGRQLTHVGRARSSRQGALPAVSPYGSYESDEIATKRQLGGREACHCF
jgi:hypothetical protein